MVLECLNESLIESHG